MKKASTKTPGESKAVRDLKRKLATIEKTKDRIAVLRTTLRGQIEEIEGICESLNTGVEDLTAGLRLINDAVDEMSRYL